MLEVDGAILPLGALLRAEEVYVSGVSKRGLAVCAGIPEQPPQVLPHARVARDEGGRLRWTLPSVSSLQIAPHIGSEVFSLGRFEYEGPGD
jgi:hypothetical protein